MRGSIWMQEIKLWRGRIGNPERTPGRKIKNLKTSTMLFFLINNFLPRCFVGLRGAVKHFVMVLFAEFVEINRFLGK